MKRKCLLAATAVFAIVGASAASATDYLYMTGTNDPWGQQSEDASMNLAFGSGNWDKANGFSTSAFSSGYKFIYFDGGDGTSTEFNSFVSNNLSAIEAFVSGGGSILLNAGRWDQPVLSTGFGSQLSSGFSGNASLTAAGLAAGLDGNGAGTSWTGGYFSHDAVTGASTCYVQGDAGCIFGKVTDGLFVGGQTAPGFQSNGGYQLLANEMTFAAADATAAVPEPASWAMMVGGFGLLGGALRRRKAAVSFA